MARAAPLEGAAQLRSGMVVIGDDIAQLRESGADPALASQLVAPLEGLVAASSKHMRKLGRRHLAKINQPNRFDFE